MPPKLLPQFADAAEVIAHANTVYGLNASALVLNVKGAQRAIEAGAKKITFVLSASEAHNQSNVRCSTDASLDMFTDIIEWQRLHAPGVAVTVAIATSFGCSIQGNVLERRVVEIAARLADGGAGEINLADTVGYANPRQVKRLFNAVRQETASLPMAAHFHDTRGMGLANVAAALEADVRIFDSALGGLGGCPFAPGASGNIATEDTAYMLEQMGLNTNVDFFSLLELLKSLATWLPNETLQGKLGKAGPAISFTPAIAGRHIA